MICCQYIAVILYHGYNNGNNNNNNNNNNNSEVRKVYNRIRDRLRERALIEGVAWPPQLDFSMLRGCYKDFAVYVGRTMRLRLEEEPLHRQL